MQRKAKFSIGDVVRHRLFSYRGIIFDVDIEFSESNSWYKQNASTHPEKDQPWYRVMVDGESYETYAAESNLESDINSDPIQHPAIRKIFNETDAGYKLRHQLN
jgi:heat shock protein HspQ